jgi:hypothetical protein
VDNRVGVGAGLASGAWVIRRSTLVNEGRDVDAGRAEVEGNATRNWWGRLPEVADCYGNVDCSDRLVAPPGSGGGPEAGFWSFEGQPADNGTPDGFEERSSVDPRYGYSRVTAEAADHGSQSYYAAEGEPFGRFAVRPAEQPYGVPQTANVSVVLRRTARVYGTDGEGSVGIRLAGKGAGRRVDFLDVRLNATALYAYTGPVIATGLALDRWVAVTVYDIDVRSDTYAVRWRTANRTGALTGIAMQTPMGDGTIAGGYTGTTVHVDEEGYVDSLSVGGSNASADRSGPPFAAPVPGTGSDGPPTDPDGDGEYEDVDGDGTAAFEDAVALAFADFGALAPDQVAALDFDGDGDADFDDAVALAFQV